MDYIESEYLELKEIINPDFKKEVIASVASFIGVTPQLSLVLLVTEGCRF